MPNPNYNNIDSDLYTYIYEQKYNKSVHTKKRIRKNDNESVTKIVVYCFLFILFFISLYSYKNFSADILPIKHKTILKTDYHKLLYPTHQYLYKDLFLGKYIIKDSKYKKSIMVDIKESYERRGLKNSLLALMEQYKKIQPSVYVWNYEDRSYVDINADMPYPAASIIKLPVLVEMFREIEQGKFSLDDKIVLEDFYRASGSGKLQYSQGGVAHSLDYLARIMIENSDNSSTNMIISKIGGMPEMNRAIKRWGLKTTHITTWLPDLEGTNITTSRELAKMLYNIDSTNILNSESKAHISDYMLHVRNGRLLKAGLPPNALILHKTGDIGFMLGDAGIVKTSTGKKYIVVILAKRPYNNLQGKDFIVKASNIIYNNIAF